VSSSANPLLGGNTDSEQAAPLGELLMQLHGSYQHLLSNEGRSSAGRLNAIEFWRKYSPIILIDDIFNDEPLPERT